MYNHEIRKNIHAYELRKNIVMFYANDLGVSIRQKWRNV